MNSNEEYLEDLLNSVNEDSASEEDSMEVGEARRTDKIEQLQSMEVEDIIESIDGDEDLDEINELLKVDSTDSMPTTPVPVVEQAQVVEEVDEETLLLEEELHDLESLLDHLGEMDESVLEMEEPMPEMEEPMPEMELSMPEMEALPESEVDNTFDGMDLLGGSDLFGTDNTEALDILQDIMSIDEQIYEEPDKSSKDISNATETVQDMPVDEGEQGKAKNKVPFWLKVYIFLFAEKPPKPEAEPAEDDGKGKKGKKGKQGKKGEKVESTEEEGDEPAPTKEEKAKSAKDAQKEAKKKEKEEKRRLQMEEVVESSKLYTKKNIIRIVIIFTSFLCIIILSKVMYEKFIYQVQAEQAYYAGEYGEVYQILYGKNLSESEQVLYDRSRIILKVSIQLDSFESYQLAGKESMALDALIQSVEQYDNLLVEAEENHVTSELDELLQLIETQLLSYGLSIEDARGLSLIEDDAIYQQTINFIVE